MATLDEARKRAKESSGGKFVRLKEDGDKVIGVFFDANVEIEERFYNQATSKYEPFTEEHKAKKLTPSASFKTNLWIRTDGTVKILQMNAPSLEGMATVLEKYGRDIAYEIQRKGKKGDTKTIYVIMPEQAPLTEAERKAIAAAEKHDLKASEDEGDATTDMHSFDKGKTNGTAPGAAAGTTAPKTAAAGAEDVIDAATVTAITGRLKQHPQAKIQEFTKTFGLAKIRELKAKDLPAAFALIESFEKAAAPPPPAGDVNPFD